MLLKINQCVFKRLKYLRKHQYVSADILLIHEFIDWKIPLTCDKSCVGDITGNTPIS